MVVSGGGVVGFCSCIQLLVNTPASASRARIHDLLFCPFSFGRSSSYISFANSTLPATHLPRSTDSLFFLLKLGIYPCDPS
ncbi:hypothetical protein LX36DRAFT_642713 [Colletotrichum falcatum]|nr:hypothetical protein LX36DRAFT_642713 [Colletotrichum falcatum]